MEKEIFLSAKEAKRILAMRTNICIHSIIIDPENMPEEETVEDICDECAYILIDGLLNGRYTLKQYAAVKNELGRIISSLKN